ncbi:MAG TPA: hypothetical protein VNV82_11420 [Bryobacteraceae bacterium]|jgi:uncharacterized protein (TIGR03437 family)|nr:hypothetical protein [Bryobacteraceae bacterium]
MIHFPARSILIAAAAALSALGQSSSSSTIAGAGYLFPAPISVAPGQVITIFARGVGGTLKQPVQAGFGSLPTSLAGISVTLVQAKNILAPILQVSPTTLSGNFGVMTAITIQIPYELQLPPPNGGLGGGVALFVTENGVAGTWSDLNAVPDQVHILTVCDTVLGGPGPSTGRCQWEVTHANGLLVSNANPASVGEELVAYAAGLCDESPDTNWSTSHATRAHRGDVQTGLQFPGRCFTFLAVFAGDSRYIVYPDSIVRGLDARISRPIPDQLRRACGAGRIAPVCFRTRTESGQHESDGERGRSDIV